MILSVGNYISKLKGFDFNPICVAVDGTICGWFGVVIRTMILSVSDHILTICVHLTNWKIFIIIRLWQK